MSVNIQTSDGLKKLADKTTKKNIEKALGYTPSSFNGDYNNLKNKPEIVDDWSDTLSINDSKGNIIFKVDKDGLHSTNLTLNSKSITEIIAENTPSGDYNDLKNAPEILENGSDELTIVDKEGNIVAKISKEGIQATHFLVGEEKKEVALKENIPEEVNLEEINTKVTAAKSDSETALSTATEAKATAEAAALSAQEANEGLLNKSNTGHTHSYYNLTDKPDISTSNGVMHMRDNSGKIQYTDDSGNIVMEVDASGLIVADVKILVNGNLISLAEAIATLLNNQG